MANRKQLQRLTLEHSLWNKWREEHDKEKINLRGADLRGKNLSGADLRVTNLISTNLDRATLTEARLWESQRARWSIHEVVCESAYWDEDGEEQTLYRPGEFERLYAMHVKIVLHYEKGISPIEIATLPILIQQLESTHPGCVLRLESIQTAAGGAAVTLVIDNTDSRNPAEQEVLKKQLEEASQQLLLSQRDLLKERTTREQIEMRLEVIRKPF